MYLEKISQILISNGKKSRSPAGLVSRWSNFVDECEDSYDWTLYEYDDEISIRDSINLILSNKYLQCFDEWNEFSIQVEKIDNKLISLFFTDKHRDEQTSWWRQGILRYAGAEYADDIQSRYGVCVEHD